ncbi:MAG: hypothetical protein ACE5ER_08595, partial [Nitrospinaceae bacterium]
NIHLKPADNLSNGWGPPLLIIVVLVLKHFFKASFQLVLKPEYFASLALVGVVLHNNLEYCWVLPAYTFQFSVAFMMMGAVNTRASVGTQIPQESRMVFAGLFLVLWIALQGIGMYWYHLALTHGRNSRLSFEKRGVFLETASALCPRCEEPFFLLALDG